MHWNHSQILAPPVIETPNVEGDVIRLLAPPGQLALPANASAPEIWPKLTLLTERLEFVDHLLCIAREFSQRTRYETKTVPSDALRTRVTKTFHLEVWGHDFAGAHYDIESLVLYLLLTCVDTIKGQEKYISPFEWLGQRYAQLSRDDSSEFQRSLDQLKREYDAEHGLSRRFKEAFTVDLPTHLQDRLVDGYAVVKLADGAVSTGSINAWGARSKEKRLERIAVHLYEVRSKFTHASIRAFCPVEPVASLPSTGKSVIVRLPGGAELLVLLRDIVVALAQKLLLSVSQD